MIAFAEMLRSPMVEAGIRVPEPDLDAQDWNSLRDDYPHAYVYLSLQLGRSMPSPSSHWDNAKVVASVPEDQIRQVTYEQLVNMGFE